MIPIYSPLLLKYKKSAINAIESEWISNHGIYIEKAENKLKEVLNSKYVILMSNGTVATHCLFKSLKFKYPNINKIYVPNNVYVAAWNCALMEYTIENLEVCPIDQETWNICENEEFILSLEKNSALMIVHNLGNIVNVPRIKRLRPDIIIIEDNCEGFYGEYENIKYGCYEGTLCSSISFYGNKTITTGEGGAFITQHEDIYNYVKKIYSQGMSDKRYIHDIHAYNYRMTNIQAAFLYDQLCDIDYIINLKNKVFENYYNLLKGNKNIVFQKANENTKRANWIFPVRLINNQMNQLETFDYFKKNEIETRPFFYSYEHHEHLKFLHKHPFCDIDLCNLLNKEIIMIPSSPCIEYGDQIKVSECIKRLF